MPLSEPAGRDHIHTRAIECRGYRRHDGLWDIEGHLTDVKAYEFSNAFRGTVKPGDALHEMWLRLTVTDDLMIVAAEAATDNAPYAICPAITESFGKLAGLRIGPGLRARVKERLGGVRGCTHLVELVWPLATTAFQTIVPIVWREKGSDGRSPDPNKAPPLINTCHAFASDGEIVRATWPEFSTAPRARRREDTPAT